MSIPEVEQRRRIAAAEIAAKKEARHASMLRMPASYFFDMIETVVLSPSRNGEEPYDILEVIDHLRRRFKVEASYYNPFTGEVAELTETRE